MPTVAVYVPSGLWRAWCQMVGVEPEARFREMCVGELDERCGAERLVLTDGLGRVVADVPAEHGEAVRRVPPTGGKRFDLKCSNAAAHIQGKACKWCGGQA